MSKDLIEKARELHHCGCTAHRDRTDLPCLKVRDAASNPLDNFEMLSLIRRLADLAESEGRRADEAEKKLERIINPPIKSLEVKDGGLSCSLDGPEMSRIIATSFWDMLTENKADNYVEMTFASPDKPLKKVVVIVRKVFGRTPHDLRVKAEAERDAALAELAALKGQQP